MDDFISPETQEILDRLNAMKYAIIGIDKSAVNKNNDNNETINALRRELECENNCNDSLRKQLKSESKISTILMITGWIFAAVCFAGWMLS